jgi:hypothetical protein
VHTGAVITHASDVGGRSGVLRGLWSRKHVVEGALKIQLAQLHLLLLSAGDFNCAKL